MIHVSPTLYSFAIVVAFLVSPFSNIERPWKPFNPILGETFEWRDGDLQFLCEQVCHHPPVSAGHGENKHFVYDIVSAPKTKFLGNSIDIYPIGKVVVELLPRGRIEVKPSQQDKTYTVNFNNINTCVTAQGVRVCS